MLKKETGFQLSLGPSARPSAGQPIAIGFACFAKRALIAAAAALAASPAIARPEASRGPRLQQLKCEAINPFGVASIEFIPEQNLVQIVTNYVAVSRLDVVAVDPARGEQPMAVHLVDRLTHVAYKIRFDRPLRLGALHKEQSAMFLQTAAADASMPGEREPIRIPDTPIAAARCTVFAGR